MSDSSTVTAFLHACIDDDEKVATSELGSYRPPESPHATRWTPSHVLAGLAVKRELLADVEIELTRTGQPRLPYLARLLAHPYRDRPGFCEEWALPPDVSRPAHETRNGLIATRRQSLTGGKGAPTP